MELYVIDMLLPRPRTRVSCGACVLHRGRDTCSDE